MQYSPHTGLAFPSVLLYLLSLGSILTTNRSFLPVCLAVCPVYCLWFCTHHQRILSFCLSCCLSCLLSLVLYSPPTYPVFLFILLFVLSTVSGSVLTTTDPVFLSVLSTVSGSVLTTNRSCLHVCSVYCLWFCTHHQQILSSCLSCCLFCLLSLVLYSSPTDPVLTFVLLFVVSTAFDSVFNTNRFCRFVRSAQCLFCFCSSWCCLPVVLLYILSTVSRGSVFTAKSSGNFSFVLIYVLSTLSFSVLTANRSCLPVRFSSSEDITQTNNLNFERSL